MRTRRFSHALFSLVVASALIGSAGGAGIHARATPFVGLVFGLSAAPDGSLLATDTGTGVIELRKGDTGTVATLTGATDVAALGRGEMFVVTSPGFEATASSIASRAGRRARLRTSQRSKQPSIRTAGRSIPTPSTSRFSTAAACSSPTPQPTRC